MRPPPFLKNCTAFLYQEENGTFVPIGSGVFLVIVEGPVVFSYIVTCKHVVKPLLDTGEPVYIRFNRSDRAIGVEYREAVGEWLYHENDAVDLAILRMSQPQHVDPLEAYAVDAGALLDAERMALTKHSIGEGDEVFFTGLFRPYHGEERNYPIYRHGHIALLTDEPIIGAYGPSDYILVEILAFPFNSGSPLFTFHIAPNANLQSQVVEMIYSIVGIVAGFYPESERMRMNDSGDIVNFTHLGISSVIPAQRVWEILNRPEVVQARKDRVDAGRKRNAPVPAGGGVYRPARLFTQGDMQQAL
jgi:hypothetical protein